MTTSPIYNGILAYVNLPRNVEGKLRQAKRLSEKNPFVKWEFPEFLYLNFRAKETYAQWVKFWKIEVNVRESENRSIKKRLCDPATTDSEKAGLTRAMAQNADVLRNLYFLRRLSKERAQRQADYFYKIGRWNNG